jgi:hypothetical protein
MNKLKIQNYNNLLNYQHFLKNNSLKREKYKLKNILFENQILYKNQDLNIIELKNSENIQIPLTVLDFKNTYTIQNLYENQLLFNYNLNYSILYNFNKIIFNYKKKKDNILKSRIVTGNPKKIIIAFLGITFPMKTINLNNSINDKKNFYNKKKLKKKMYRNFKNKKIKKIIRSYKLRYLNFKIENNKNKFFFSRISYIEDILKYIPIKKLKKQMLLERKKKKSNLSRKEYVKKQKNKNNYATI